MQQKEENLDKKLESLDRKEDSLNGKIKQAEERLAEAEAVKRSQFEMLERISGYTADQAKEYLLKNLENELAHDKAVKLMEFEQQTRDEAEKSAREIISMAIQRCAADHVAEATISVVPLPNDEMKGRIIGREGPQHPRHRNAHRRRSHHRRYTGGHHALLLRACAPRGGAHCAGAPDCGRPHPPRAH